MAFNFLDPVEAAKAQAEAIKAIGQFKLATAQAELTRAIADGERVKAGARRLVVKQLERAMTLLAAQNAQLKARIAHWETMGKQLSFVQDAEAITQNGIMRMWQGYTTFRRLATSEANQDIDSTEINTDDRKKSNYTLIAGNGRQPLSDDVPNDITNLAKLITWLKLKTSHAIPNSGTRPFTLVRNAFLQMAGARAQTEIASLQAMMKEIQDRTFQAWRPIVLAPFLDNPAIKAIVNAKPKDAAG